MPVVTCTCGNKRIHTHQAAAFLCEVCLWKDRKPRVFEPVSVSTYSTTWKFQDGKGKHRPWLRQNANSEVKISLSYEKYIGSGVWLQKRLLALKERGRLCEACACAKNLHVHHVTYERLGAEEVSDLRILCENCHDRLHIAFDESRKKRKKWRSLEEFTDRFIRRAHIRGKGR